MAYVELHARSAFSWLRGGSMPEALAAEAGRLQMPALALCAGVSTEPSGCTRPARKRGCAPWWAVNS